MSKLKRTTKEIKDRMGSANSENQKATSEEYRKKYDGIQWNSDKEKSVKVRSEDDCGCYPGSLAPCRCKGSHCGC